MVYVRVDCASYVCETAKMTVGWGVHSKECDVRERLKGFMELKCGKAGEELE